MKKLMVGFAGAIFFLVIVIAVRVAMYGPAPPPADSPATPIDGPAFQRLTAAIADVAPDALITPHLVVGATDARLMTD